MHEEKTSKVRTCCGTDEISHNRTLYILKARNGKGGGYKLAFDFDNESLTLKELRLIVKKMDNNFLKLKNEIENELGRPLDIGEENTLKGLYYFDKDVKLKGQIESEPEPIRPIAERALRDIKARMKKQCLCRNGCNRPAIKSRLVYAECHNRDMRANYLRHKIEHEKWRQKTFAKKPQQAGNPDKEAVK